MSSATSADYMFKEAVKFQSDLSGWNTAKLSSCPVEFNLDGILTDMDLPTICQ